jgi:hypothetical protein
MEDFFISKEAAARCRFKIFSDFVPAPTTERYPRLAGIKVIPSSFRFFLTSAEACEYDRLVRPRNNIPINNFFMMFTF